MSNQILWLVIIIVMLVIEIVTVGNLVSIWFAIGAGIAFGLSYFVDSVFIQGITFFVVSIASLFLIRPLTRNTLRGNEIATNADSMIGRKVKLASDITEDTWGSVKINGSVWTAVSVNQVVIAAGTQVEIIAIDGVKLVVRELQD